MLHKLAFPSDGQLSPNQSHALLSVLSAYADVFAEASDDGGRTSMTHYRIHTGDPALIRPQPRHIPAAR